MRPIVLIVFIMLAVLPASGVAASPGWPSSSAEDAELSKRVKRALLEAPGVNALGVEVRAEDAQVTLSGAVANAAERKRIVEIASSVDGVAELVNRLVVAGGS